MFGGGGETLLNFNYKSKDRIKENSSMQNSNILNNNNNLLANNQQNLINEEPEESESFENNTEKLDLKDAKKPVPAVFDVSFDNKCIGVIPEQH